MFPELRLGFIVAPPWAMDALVAAKQYSDLLSPFINQYALAAFIADGHLARHIRKMRSIYNQRRRLLLDGLPGWLHPIPSFAGLHIAALVKDSRSADDLVERARDVGVGIGTVGRFSVGKLDLQGLVFGYGAIPERSVVEGIARLKEPLEVPLPDPLQRLRQRVEAHRPVAMTRVQCEHVLIVVLPALQRRGHAVIGGNPVMHVIAHDIRVQQVPIPHLHPDANRLCAGFAQSICRDTPRRRPACQD